MSRPHFPSRSLQPAARGLTVLALLSTAACSSLPPFNVSAAQSVSVPPSGSGSSANERLTTSQDGTNVIVEGIGFPPQKNVRIVIEITPTDDKSAEKTPKKYRYEVTERSEKNGTFKWSVRNIIPPATPVNIRAGAEILPDSPAQSNPTATLNGFRSSSNTRSLGEQRVTQVAENPTATLLF